jgi:hypothetical protein
MSRLLQNKNAIIYGAAGGSDERWHLRSPAREPRCFWPGEPVRPSTASPPRSRRKTGAPTWRGSTHSTTPRSTSTGTVDVRFNLISRGDLQGTPLLEMDVEDFMRPISVGARSDFVTARAAARHIGAPAVGGDPDDLERIRRGTQGLARLSDG